MSISSDNQPDPAPITAGGDDPEAKLAHELAGLLDGSLRNIGLVMSSLRDPRNAPAMGGDDDLVRRLDTANQAMQHMATLIQRWMGRNHSPAGLHQQSRTLHETVHAAAKLLAPVAATRRAKLHVEISLEAANLPAGPIYPVIANALRNSIESIGQRGPHDTPHGGSVQLFARIIGDQVEIRIIDDGPGVSPTMFEPNGELIHGRTTKHNGQGLGLALARDIARDLNGSVRLHNRQPLGAELVFCYPVASVNI